MQKNDLIRVNSSIYRVLAMKENSVLIIDTLSLNMPKWVDISMCDGWEKMENDKLIEITKREIPAIETLSQEQMKIMHKRFTLIAPILSCIEDDTMRFLLINETASKHNLTKQTIRKYLCLYLAYPNITVLAPIKKEPCTALTTDEKNFRYALNKYFYTRCKNSLKTTYLYLLRDKYTDEKRELIQGYPTFRQFQYFYTKHKNYQTYYISRDGLTNYQRNNRPLLGDSVRDFAPNVGVGMLDSTICDIYLVNESKEVVGRPILAACIDGYSGMCLGYYLGWEGGVYSIRELACIFEPNNSYERYVESGERLECQGFYNDRNYKMSIGVECEQGALEYYDYDVSYLVNGMSYQILPNTKTERYVFGIAWIDNVDCDETVGDNNTRDTQTWFAADPT